MARKSAINFHPAPLPEFGGFAFYNLAILEEKTSYGCTCHHMDSSFDTGDIVKVRTFPMNYETDTALSLERKTQKEMLLLFDEIIDLINDKSLPSVPQDPKKHRYYSLEQFETEANTKNC